jgi:hypothetical protein
MKYLKFIILSSLFLLGLSCQDEEQQRLAETKKAAKVNDSILKNLSNNWRFDIPAVSPKASTQLQNWSEWEQFRSELAQKPTGSLTAYRQKAKNLVTKADQLLTNIPPFFAKPQVRSRISVLVTKTKMLYTYLNIEVVQEQKAIGLIKEITREMASLQNQFDELIRKSEIQKEAGEEEMLRALDTTRMANPDAIPQPSTTQPQHVARKRVFSTPKNRITPERQ